MQHQAQFVFRLHQTTKKVIAGKTPITYLVLAFISCIRLMKSSLQQCKKCERDQQPAKNTKLSKAPHMEHVAEHQGIRQSSYCSPLTVSLALLERIHQAPRAHPHQLQFEPYTQINICRFNNTARKSPSSLRISNP